MNEIDRLCVEVVPGSILDEFAKMVEWQRSGRSPEGWRLGHAFRQWHRHAAAFAGPDFDDHRAAYERAAAFGASQLQRFTTLDALIDHYFDDRHYKKWPRGRYHGAVPVDPVPGTVERWVEDAIADAGDAELFRPMVEELAFWRRSQELVGQRAA